MGRMEYSEQSQLHKSYQNLLDVHYENPTWGKENVMQILVLFSDNIPVKQYFSWFLPLSLESTFLKFLFIFLFYFCLLFTMATANRDDGKYVFFRETQMWHLLVRLLLGYYSRGLEHSRQPQTIFFKLGLQFLW